MVKNYNLNVTEVMVSDFKNAFPVIFNSTVGILRTGLFPNWSRKVSMYKSNVELQISEIVLPMDVRKTLSCLNIFQCYHLLVKCPKMTQSIKSQILCDGKFTTIRIVTLSGTF